jgi:hypothetical protein
MTVMRWHDARIAHPNQWLLIEALDARTEDHRRVVEQMTVLEVCPDGGAAFRRYRDLRSADPERELYFVHTCNPELTIEERPWLGIRRNDAHHATR